jgi:hypothetical protein
LINTECTERATYAAEGHIDRRAFRLRWNQDLDVGALVLGDEVEIVAHVEGIRDRA